ncbi:MAG: glycosyltransferase family 2 protein [Burkholderiaceae bacterium]
MPAKPSPSASRAGAVQFFLAHGLFALVLASWLLSLLGGLWLDSLLAWGAGLFYVSYDTWLLAYVAWHTRNLRAEPATQAVPALPGELPAAVTSNPRLTLGVLIAARNEELMLPVCLRALLAQSDVPDEIFVIDDGSTDATRAVLARDFGLLPHQAQGAHYSRAGGICVLHKANAGKASALNDGLQHIRADVVITIDADTLLAPGAVAAMRQAFSADAQLVAACGVLRPRCAPGWRGRVFEWFQTFEYLRAFLSRVAWMRIDALLLVSGAFAAYRLGALQQVGGYRANSRVEDYELIHRMHRHSHDHALAWRIRVVSQARAETDAPATLGSFLRQRARWFAGFLETLRDNRDMLGNARYAAVGRFMLPIKVVDTMQPVFGLTAFALLVYFVVTQQPVLRLVLLVIALKLLLDVLFHLWSVHLYHRWLGQRVPPTTWLLAVLAAFAEPFSFQLLRHSGALSGWGSFLSKRTDWMPQRQARLRAPD